MRSEGTQVFIPSRGISTLHKVLLLNGALNLGLLFPSYVDTQPHNVHHHGDEEE